MRSDKRVPGGTWRGLVVAIVVWSFWTILPAALLDGSQMRAVAAAQLGASAVAYLQTAPPALCWYLILGQYLMLPALLAISSRLRHPSGRAESAPQARSRWLHSVLPFFGWWLALYFAGNAVVTIVDLRHGAALEVVRGYALYLGLYGFLASLPLWGFVLLCRVVLRRFWLSALASVFGSALVAVSGLVLSARHYQLPTSAWLRSQLLSGRADLVARGAWGCLLWSSGLALLALGLLLLPSLRVRAERLPPTPRHGI